MNQGSARSSVRFEPNERPPLAVTVGLALQFAILCIAGIVLTPAIVVRAGGGSEDYLTWAAFGAVVVSGVATIVQAARVGRIGSGYILLMGTSGAFISVSAFAISEGGPAMLATLVVISALFQFLLGARLSLLRRILTPGIGGTVIMLIPVTVMPLGLGMIEDVPENSTPAAAGVAMLATLGVMVVCALRATGAFRLWAPVIGVVCGSVVGAYLGLYDFSRVQEAAWIGAPRGSWPGLDLSFGPTFWSLLPAFVFVTMVGAIETIGDSIAIQGVSWRKPRAVDYRVVQGAVNADGLGNLLSGLVGTVPNTTYSTSVSMTELTGIASRSVGVAIGVVFIGMAFLPKVLALVLAIPGPVVAAFVLVVLSMLFVLGMRIVVQDGIDYRKGLLVGVSFWVGVGVENDLMFPGFFAEFAGGLLQNGMTSGGLVAIFLSLLMELARPRSQRIEMPASIAELPRIKEFLNSFGARNGWSAPAMDRIHAATEETLLTILQIEGNEDTVERKLLLNVRRQEDKAMLEFIAGPGEDNLQDRISVLGEPTSLADVEQEMSLRLLRHFASSVRHQQYHDVDVVTIQVDVR